MMYKCYCCLIFKPRRRFHSPDALPPAALPPPSDVDTLFSRHARRRRLAYRMMDEDGLRRCLDDGMDDDVRRAHHQPARRRHSTLYDGIMLRRRRRRRSDQYTSTLEDENGVDSGIMPRRRRRRRRSHQYTSTLEDENGVDSGIMPPRRPGPQYIPVRQRRRAGPSHVPSRQQHLTLDDDDDDDTEVNLRKLLRCRRLLPLHLPRLLLTLDDFYRILLSDDLNPPIRYQVDERDMRMPFSHYFIYSGSGHNPYYLEKTRPPNQRRRSDEPIIRALKMGVRAIELALWPNSKENDIKVHHGWTRDTPVSLAECLKSIRKNAFVASPYPVIITLEDNLRSSDLQKKAAKVVLDVLGLVLHYPPRYPFGNAPSGNPLELLGNIVRDYSWASLSPEELTGRVILSTMPPSLLKKDKGKPIEVDVPKVHSTIQQGDDNQPHVSKGADDDGTAWGPEVPVFQTDKMQSDDQKHDGGVLVQSRRRNNDHYYDEDEDEKEREIIMQGRRIYTNTTFKRVSNLDVDCGTDIVRFTQRNILQIYPSVSKDYPKASRLTSSNYNPFLGWVHGAQMVALNMQEYGRALWLMHGFYRANGGCGYVRKPDFLMQTQPDFLMQTQTEVFDPRKRQPVKKTLKVKVYMGDGWLRDFKHAHTSFIPDLWTSVGIAGVPADTTAMKNTRATENTWVPVWEHEFSFDLTVPEMALLRVEVHQYDVSERDVFGGQTVLPVWELRPGIRAVPLFDRQGNRLDNVRLLMRFEYALPWTMEYACR